ncbi:MAG: hypothetical protein WCB11_02255 [Terriglobales bacterium]
MKTTFRLLLAELVLLGTASLLNAQTPEVTHNTWKSAAPMPTPAFDEAAAVLNDEIYVIGGSTTEAIADVQIYNPATNA